MATGLKINFTKSTLVPMNVQPQKVTRIANILGCQKASFPQVYLGLPLSNTKLNITAFALLIAKVDRWLSGWQGALLNHTGRLILVNSVLDGLATFIMQALPLPVGVIEQIDSKHQAFLLKGSEKASGTNCLVAWETAQKTKEEGGLGVKHLATQNACLVSR